MKQAHKQKTLSGSSRQGFLLDSPPKEKWHVVYSLSQPLTTPPGPDTFDL